MPGKPCEPLGPSDPLVPGIPGRPGFPCQSTPIRFPGQSDISQVPIIRGQFDVTYGQTSKSSWTLKDRRQQSIGLASQRGGHMTVSEKYLRAREAFESR